MALCGRRATGAWAGCFICLLLSWPLILLDGTQRPDAAPADGTSGTAAARERGRVASPFALTNAVLSTIENRYPGSGGTHFSGGGGDRLAAARKGVEGALSSLPAPTLPTVTPALVPPPQAPPAAAPRAPIAAVPLRRPAASWPCAFPRPTGKWVPAPQGGPVPQIQKSGAGSVFIEAKTPKIDVVYEYDPALDCGGGGTHAYHHYTQDQVISPKNDEFRLKTDDFLLRNDDFLHKFST